LKRSVLIRHLRRHGCDLLREGSKHSVFVHRQNGAVSTVPRHREIADYLARKICRDLDILEP
jgi:mRNA interferase HicA